jgi:hypothetical protein
VNIWCQAAEVVVAAGQSPAGQVDAPEVKALPLAEPAPPARKVPPMIADKTPGTESA